MNKYELNLKRFDVQTTLLNDKDGGNDLSPEMKTYYDKTLLDNAEPNLVHDQFGQERPIPKGNGKTIEFRRFSMLPKATTPLTEGVTPAGNKLNVTNVLATIAQYGDYITTSDVLEMTAIDPIITESLALLGSQAGRTLDTISREELQGGTNVYYVPKRATDGTETAVTTRTGLDKTSALTVKDVYMAVAILKGANAPRIDGKYASIIHPYTAIGLQADAGSGWRGIMQYAKAEQLLTAEIGEFAGVRFVESTEAKIWEKAGATDATESEKYSVFGTLFLGANAYGKTQISGMGLQTIVKQQGSGGTTDPLNQRSSVGWKATKATKRLTEEYMVRVESVVPEFPFAPAN